ncbi:hypothetical protein BS78_06G018600 [Paspalum vaginatum]|nr:hypothetical protein BS78_06G018600 [Paspalum vaginatum]KAJ1269965.1 hypothetical protein BS78_06G018600 [Paspalum vaginatum]
MHPWAVAPPLHAATPSTAYRGLPSSRSPLDGRPQTPPSCCAAGSRAPCRVSAQRLRRWWTCCCDFAGRRRGWATAPVPRNPGLCVPAHCVSAGSSGNCAVAWRPARRRSGGEAGVWRRVMRRAGEAADGERWPGGRRCGAVR